MLCDGKAAKVTKLVPSRPLTLSDAIRPLGGNEFLIIEGAGRLDRMRIQGDGAVIETLKDGYVVPTGVTVIGPHRLDQRGPACVCLRSG